VPEVILTGRYFGSQLGKFAFDNLLLLCRASRKVIRGRD